jgi:transposase
LGAEHRCEWRDRAFALEAELSEIKSTLAKLQRHVFGKRSEKMPSVKKALERTGTAAADPEEVQKRRRERAETKKALPEVRIPHRVEDSDKTCLKCGGHEFSPLGKGKETTVYEYVPAHFEKQVHVQETLRCKCGETVLTAKGAPKAFHKAGYGPGLLAQVVVKKCADAIPLYRQAKDLRRHGVPMARSTLCDLFHRAAIELDPLAKRLMELVAKNEIVQADETTMRVLAEKKTRTAWLWTFIAKEDQHELISYAFSNSRSGETPARILGDTQGKLVVDGYTGYNKVTAPDGRERVGCLAHVRRKFFDALETAPAAQAALDFILEIYRVERAAFDANILGTKQHLALRQERSKKIMAEFETWLLEEQPKHLPKGPLGVAIRYALNHFEPLTRFLDDENLPVDNNASERALRAAALGRKNWLFVGHDKAGENMASLFSLIATCEANGINPYAYLKDVLIRVQAHPAARIDELLPHRWQPLANTS